MTAIRPSPPAGPARPEGPEAPPLQVVATAGHVDHGKSALILRLTGIDPDRLAEEKRRGLTIDLGFAWTTLPSGREVGFVDVPGHERFIRNMLAGVGPVRLVLFVVAADEGWKPQSEEHLQIVDVLGAHGAIVALTKRDLQVAHPVSRVAVNLAGSPWWRAQRPPERGSTSCGRPWTACWPRPRPRNGTAGPGSSWTACSPSGERAPWSPGPSPGGP